MASWDQRAHVEDIPLIDHPTIAATARSTYPLSTVKRKPVPIRNHDFNNFPWKKLPDHSDYRTMSGAKDDSYENENDAMPTKYFPSRQIPHPTLTQGPGWLPYALRLPSFLSIIFFGLLLLVVVLTLRIQSIKHNGLANDSDGAALYFAWRFMSTLLAVSYVTMLMIVLDAIRYTEAFKRLTSRSGASAESSIPRKPEAWWVTLIDSFPRKQNGRRFSVAMSSAVIAYILGLFLISPFSSALLQVKQVSTSEVTSFDTVRLDNNLPLPMRPGTLDYAQTMAHILQNVTTSPWIVNEYAVAPFWPTQQDRPAGAKFVQVGHSWQAKTIILKSEIEYEKLLLTGVVENLNWTQVQMLGNRTYNFSINVTSYTFKAQSGCEYGVAFNNGTGGLISNVGGLYWSNLTDVPLDQFWWIQDDRNQSLHLNHTSQCEPGEVLLAFPPTTDPAQAFGYIFRPSYSSAVLSVKAVSTSDVTLVTFDESEFDKVKTPIINGFINTTAFNSAFVSSIWNNFLVDPRQLLSTPRAGGPAKLLAAYYEFQMPALLHGNIITTGPRVVVISAVAIVLEVILLVTIILLILLTWFTRLSRRPVGVAQNTAFVNTVISLISSENDVTVLRRTFRQACDLPTEDKRNIICRLANHRLDMSSKYRPIPDYERPHDTAVARKNSVSSGSGLLSGWMVFLLALFVCVLVIAIAVLYWYSVTYGLSQHAFTYQVMIGGDTDSIGRIAPYAIIPTLLGVITGLWWGSIEYAFRSVQPFIAMTRRPTTNIRGTGLSYQSSYLAWAGVRAWSHGHWLLGLVCTGAFFSQIFTISMSALWQPVSSCKNSTAVLEKPFQLREVPQLYIGSAYHSSPQQAILPQLFKNFTTNWLYGAFSQLTVNASEPSWSSEGWSFIPVSFDSLKLTDQTRKNTNKNNTDTFVTVTVPAIRGRLECEPLAPNLDSRYYSTQVNSSLFNGTVRSSSPSDTYYRLGCTGISAGSSTYINFQPNMTATKDNCSYVDSITGIIAATVDVECCVADENLLPANSILSHWSPILTKGYATNVTSGSKDFKIAVKTIYGPSPAPNQNAGRETTLLWPAIPSLAMLKCVPVIETTSSTVMVNIDTKQVKTYELLDKVTPYEPAWTDNYVQHKLAPNWPEFGTFDGNYTLSFGPMFMTALLGAAQLELLGGCTNEGGVNCYEQIDDQTFNYHAPGMNLDYMSYSMLALASYNMSAMLDYTRMIPLAQQVFTTFFQHFASSNVPTNGTGGWAYQRATETLPQDLQPPAYAAHVTTPQVGNAAPATITAIFSEPIEKLQMSPVAVYLCLAILVWLLVTTLLILVSKNPYFSPLIQPIETIADVLCLVAYSDCYLELARQKGATGLKNDKQFRIRLGWFRSRYDGEARWGIELADDSRAIWMTDEEVRESLQVKGR